MRKTLSAVLAVLAVGALALSSLLVGGPASAAQSAGPTLHFDVSGRIAVLAEGAALAVPVSYVCPSKYGGSTGYAVWTSEVQEQLADGTVVDGYDAGGPAAYLTCDGALHQHEIIVLPFAQNAFRAPGSASVTTSVLACNAAETNCKQPTKTYPASLHAASAGDPANQPLDGRATLLADGSVRVTLDGGCPAGSTSDGSAALSQRVRGEHVTSGLTDSEPTCTASHTTLLLPTAPFPVRRGVAYVIGDRRTCAGLTCTDDTTFRGVVDIR